VVIATVFLSIIGMSAGLVLGSHHESPQPPDDSGGIYVPIEPTSDAKRCPDEMHDTASRLGFEGTLNQVLRVRAVSTGTTVWICRNEEGRLFYQSNKGGYDQKWIEGETALFLSNVVPKDDGYLATADDGNTFFVDEQRLEVVAKGKKRSWDVTPE
jgi:hypothetical protein